MLFDILGLVKPSTSADSTLNPDGAQVSVEATLVQWINHFILPTSWRPSQILLHFLSQCLSLHFSILPSLSRVFFFFFEFFSFKFFYFLFLLAGTLTLNLVGEIFARSAKMQQQRLKQQQQALIQQSLLQQQSLYHHPGLLAPPQVLFFSLCFFFSISFRFASIYFPILLLVFSTLCVILWVWFRKCRWNFRFSLCRWCLMSVLPSRILQISLLLALN